MMNGDIFDYDHLTLRSSSEKEILAVKKVCISSRFQKNLCKVGQKLGASLRLSRMVIHTKGE